MVSGFKGKSISVEKVVRTTIDQLKRQAGSKYDPEMTVIKAKSLRTQPDSREQTQTPAEESTNTVLPPKEETSHTTFKLPDNAGKLNELVHIVTTHTGNQEITVGSKTFFLNDE